MIKIATFAAMGLALLAVPAAAQSQSNSPAVQKADQAARTTIRSIYGEAGRRACGARCAAPAARAGEAIYSGAQKASRAGAERIQRVGRRVRQRDDR